LLGRAWWWWEGAATRRDQDLPKGCACISHTDIPHGTPPSCCAPPPPHTHTPAPPPLRLRSGYAGELTAAAALDAAVNEGNVLLVDIRTQKEKEASGIPDVPSSASGKVR
jgi:hypothetical protein